MKYLLPLILLVMQPSLSFAETASDMTFVTEFTNFACKSFRDQVSAPREIEDLGIKFTKLGIAKNTRRVIIDIESVDGLCQYSADYSRTKGEKQLRFTNSTITSDEACNELKEALDEIMEPGFKYAIKFNAYISMLFLAPVSGPCDEISGQSLIEFQWKL